MEWGAFNIRVVGIAPGPIAETPGMTKLAPGDSEVGTSMNDIYVPTQGDVRARRHAGGRKDPTLLLVWMRSWGLNYSDGVCWLTIHHRWWKRR